MIGRALSLTAALVGSTVGTAQGVAELVARSVRTMSVGPVPVASTSDRQSSGRQSHVAVRGLHLLGSDTAAERLERDLLRHPAVHTAQVNAVLGRVTVAHDPAVLDVDAVAVLVADAQRGHGLHEAPFAPSARSHPADPGFVQWASVAFVLDVAGLGYAAVGRFVVVPTLTPVLPAVIGLAESAGRLRTPVETVLGRPAADAMFGVTGAVLRTFSRQSLGLVADAGHRFGKRSEACARAGAWAELDALLAGRDDGHRTAPLPQSARPVRLPDGPVEQVGNRSAALAATGSLGVLAATRDPQRATAALLAGVPRAAGLGREGFATQVGRDAAGRGAVIFDGGVLHRLDRVDTVVLDASVLLSGRRRVDEVELLDGSGAGVAELTERLHDLVDLRAPRRRRHIDEWSVEPVDSDPGDLPGRAQRWFGEGATVLRVLRADQPVGWASVVVEAAPLAAALVRAAGAAGTVLGCGVDRRVAARLGIEETVPGGSRLVTSIRARQDAGHVVALVSAAGPEALATADVGIGLLSPGRPTPWGAHVICRSAGGAHLLLDSMPAARTASRQSAQLAMAGSGLGALLSMFGSSMGAPARASIPVGTAALLALAAGTWSGMGPGRRPLPVPAAEADWHAMSPQAVLGILEGTRAGLPVEVARQRLDEHPRLPAEEAEIGLFRASVEELANPVTPALVAAAGISASIGSTVDSLLIVGLLGVNALIGGAQRLGAQQELRRLDHAAESLVRVRRGNGGTPDEWVREDALVAGDVVELGAGDAVPADCRLVSAHELEVDESSLTGESVLAVKSVAAVWAPQLADRTSMLYQASVVVTGRAVAVVVSTGTFTESGRAAQADEHEPPPTGVQNRLSGLAVSTIRLSVVAGAALMAVDLVRGRSVPRALGRAVNLAVASVPEGLPFVATVAELAAARRLSAQGVLTRDPSTIEALGRVDMLCFDKTGTLTEGRISLHEVSDGTTTRSVDDLTPELSGVLAVAARATPWQRPEHQVAHQTDRAVLVAARQLGVSPDRYTNRAGPVEQLGELPFESSRGFHATLSRRGTDHRLTVKGAPEVVLGRCVLERSRRTEIDAEVERIAARGHRVVALAERGVDGPCDVVDAAVRELTFRGLLVLADRVRPTAADAVAALGTAGVTVMMVTGDHPATARAVAVELGMLGDRSVLTGVEVDAMDDAKLTEIAPGTGVFARVSPAQKARIVRCLQAGGSTVAVTGDGTNDAPAIRLADVGIALGSQATPAAREAADLVVTENRIETILDAIVEGRGMWSSVRDALSILLGGNLGEIGYAVATGLVSRVDTMNARQLLLVNLMTDVLPAMAVAMRPPPDALPADLLTGGPEAALGAGLTRDIYARATTTSVAATVAWLLARPTGTAGQASTTGLVALVGAQLGQTLAVRGRTPIVAGAAIGSMVLLAVVVQTPVISRLLGCRPLLPHQWAIALGAACAATGGQLVVQRINDRRPANARPRGAARRGRGPSLSVS